MSDKIDSSGISHTAHYTGEIWRQHGMSEEFLATRMGKQLYLAGRPIEFLARTVIGVNNEIPLLQRHRIIDHLTSLAIEQQGVTQIVELACGLSPRGVSMRRRYPHIRYIEADLPAMADHKRTLLQQQNLISERHRVLSCDVLAREGDDTLEKLFEQLDPSQPVLVITEGLVNYFELKVIAGFWQRLAACLKAFPAGHYLTDIYPDLSWHVIAPWARLATRLLSRSTRAHVRLHFNNDIEMADAFRGYGFNSVKVCLPENFYGLLEIPIQRVPSIVRVIQASI